MILKTIKYTFLIFSFFFYTYLFFINYKLYYQPTFLTKNELSYNSDQLKHLRFLRTKIDQEAATKMQNIYPEGFIFMNVLYGLAWVEFAEKIKDKNHPFYKESLLEIEKALDEIYSTNGKRIFPHEQRIKDGAFYTGWSTYLLGKKLALSQEFSFSELKLFQDKCEEIAIVINSGHSPYVESYPNQVWPADIFTAVASLKIHDSFLEEKYEEDIFNWIQRVKRSLDKKGMIPHSEMDLSDSGPFKPFYEEARGSSMSLMLNFLFEIDEEFGKEQFKLYKENFLAYRFGLPGIREYPKGINSTGDIDSGPVLLSVGGSASVVGQRTMALFGEKNIAKGLRNSIEGFGIALSNQKNKYYLLGQLPMADVFFAWANGIEIETIKIKKNYRWRLKFHFYSILILIVNVILYSYIKKGITTK